MSTDEESKTGSLIVVGTGIRVVGQLTMEALAWIKRADRVLYIVADRVAEDVIKALNPAGAESLVRLYADGKPRMLTYHRIVDRILTCVQSGMCTCAVAYGHPGVFAYPYHEAIRQARALGYPARMLPAVSAEDCLFADLGVDPASHGCQSYEAIDFLLYRRSADCSAALVLWQIGVMGDPMHRRGSYNLSLLPALVARLCRFYSPDHVCTIYEAAVPLDAEPKIQQAPLRNLIKLRLRAGSTLYIPPARRRRPDPLVLSQLGALMVSDAQSMTVQKSS